MVVPEPQLNMRSVPGQGAGRQVGLPRPSGLSWAVYWLPAVGTITLVVVWQIVGSVVPQQLSTPIDVVDKIASLVHGGGLIGSTLSTLTSLAEGWVIASISGVAIGVVIGATRFGEVALEPYVMIAYTVPKVALVPLLVVWFGVTEEFLVATVVLASVFVVAIPTADGVRKATTMYREVCQSLFIKRRNYIYRVLVPGALPLIMYGFRLSVQRGLLTLLVAEMFAGLPGLGYLLGQQRAALDSAGIFAIALATLLLGLLLTALLRAGESLLRSYMTEGSAV